MILYNFPKYGGPGTNFLIWALREKKEKKKNVVAEQNVSDITIHIMPKPCRSDFHITYKAK